MALHSGSGLLQAALPQGAYAASFAAAGFPVLRTLPRLASQPKHSQGAAVARAGDVVGCGLDYRLGVAFFTLNGARILHGEVRLPMQLEWRPLVGSSSGGAAIHRLSCSRGGGTRPRHVHDAPLIGAASALLLEGGGAGGGGGYAYDLLAREEDTWTCWCDGAATREGSRARGMPEEVSTPCPSGATTLRCGSFSRRSTAAPSATRRSEAGRGTREDPRENQALLR